MEQRGYSWITARQDRKRLCNELRWASEWSKAFSICRWEGSRRRLPRMRWALWVFNRSYLIFRELTVCSAKCRQLSSPTHAALVWHDAASGAPAASFSPPIPKQSPTRANIRQTSVLATSM